MPTTEYARHYAGAVIRGGKDRYLLIHDHRKKERPWRFPGGRIEQEIGELPLQALVRELWEELGITVESADLIAETYTEIDGGAWVGHFFAVNSYDGIPEIKEPSKHDDWQYFSAQEIHDMGDMAEGDKLIAIVAGLEKKPTGRLEF